jgi:hypothetical protein
VANCTSFDVVVLMGLDQVQPHLIGQLLDRMWVGNKLWRKSETAGIAHGMANNWMALMTPKLVMAF